MVVWPIVCQSMRSIASSVISPFAISFVFIACPCICCFIESSILQLTRSPLINVEYRIISKCIGECITVPCSIFCRKHFAFLSIKILRLSNLFRIVFVSLACPLTFLAITENETFLRKSWMAHIRSKYFLSILTVDNLSVPINKLASLSHAKVIEPP